MQSSLDVPLTVQNWRKRQHRFLCCTLEVVSVSTPTTKHENLKLSDGTPSRYTLLQFFESPPVKCDGLYIAGS